MNPNSFITTAGVTAPGGAGRVIRYLYKYGGRGGRGEGGRNGNRGGRSGRYRLAKIVGCGLNT